MQEGINWNVNHDLDKFGWKIHPGIEINNFNDFEVAFLLSPDIPVPNLAGNAIATLTTTLATKLPFRTIIFSTRPSDIVGQNSIPRSMHIAYYQKEIGKSIWDRGKLLPVLRHLFITPTLYSWRRYAKGAALACVDLGVKCLVIEDIADFGWAVRFLKENNVAVVLHQHACTQRNFKTFLWKRIEMNLSRIIFVANKPLALTENVHGKIKIPASVIYNGIDLDHYDPQRWVERTAELRKELHILSDQRIILFVGRLAASKGIHLALQSFLTLNRKDMHFIVIGGIDHLTDPKFHRQLEELKTEILRQGLSVHFLENISQGQLPPYYGLADYVLVPPTSFEGLPKVVTEALAMGVPVIASDRGGIWELLKVGKNSWKIADPVTPDTIRTAIVEALSTSSATLNEMEKRIMQDDRPHGPEENVTLIRGGIIHYNGYQMNILFISYPFWPPSFGGELLISIERFLELAKRGYHITVLTSGVPGSSSYEVRDGIEIFRSPVIQSSRLGRGLRRLLFPIWVNRKLGKFQADVVHLSSAGGVGPISSNLGLTLINNKAHRCGARTVYVHSLADTGQFAFSTNGMYFRMRNLFLKQVDAIVSVSPALHRGVLQIFPKQAVCILNSVRDDIFKPIPNDMRRSQRDAMGINTQEIVFCFIGSISRRKGFDLLARAFADLCAYYPNWRLWVIGPRTLQESRNIDLREVQEVCSPLADLDHQVRYWGRVDDRNQLACLISSSDIFILPTLREGMPLAPMESMAAGIPVIVARLPGVTDIANLEGETGLLFKPGDISELKSAMLKMAASPELRDRMGKAAAQRIHDHFSWQEHVYSWENMYQTLSKKVAGSNG